MAVSALRRYTPPTCTLEIMAQTSLLSRWADRSVLKNVRFRLALDGPHRSLDEYLRVEGDRTQLETLCDQVETYVQQMLTQSASRFNADFFNEASQPSSHLASNHLASNGSAHLEAMRSYHPPQPAELGRSLGPPDVMIERDRQRATTSGERHLQAVPTSAASSSGAIAIQPQGKLKHKLSFGALATEDSSSSTVLSTLELFDLASALDQYRADNLAMPELQRQGWMGSTPNWLKAAAVFVFALGVGAPLTQVILQSERFSSGSSESASSDVQSPSAAEREDLSELAPGSRRDAGIPGRLRGRLQEPAPQRPNQRAGNGNGAGQAGAAGQQQQGNGTATGTAPGTAPGTTANGAGADGTATPSRGVPPELAAIPPINQGESIRRPQSAPSSADEPESGAIASAPSSSSSLSRASDFAGEAPQSAGAVPESAMADAPAAPTSAIPQVNEIRDYFQSQWQPPEDLDRSIEYRLLLNPNGSVQQIDPLGQTARTYSGQIGLPTVGAPFVSAAENGRPAQVRVIFQPDGRVRAFLESWN
ncbi:MAG: DUF4335 domain-containing protein [Elainellaceae cyanobacterium]